MSARRVIVLGAVWAVGVFAVVQLCRAAAEDAAELLAGIDDSQPGYMGGPA